MLNPTKPFVFTTKHQRPQGFIDDFVRRKIFIFHATADSELIPVTFISFNPSDSPRQNVFVRWWKKRNHFNGFFLPIEEAKDEAGILKMLKSKAAFNLTSFTFRSFSFQLAKIEFPRWQTIIVRTYFYE